MGNRRVVIFGVLCATLLSPSGCRKSRTRTKSNGPTNVTVEGNLPSNAIYPAPVVFDIKASNRLEAQKNGRLYDCTYRAKGKTARFRVWFVIHDALQGKVPVYRAEGKFMSVAGSDDVVLLDALKTTLEADHAPEEVTKVRELDFDAVVLGERLNRDTSDGFFADPPGDWTASKIFLPKGGDQGEVFFNFNPVIGKGEFSLKDADYGDYVLGELAKVL